MSYLNQTLLEIHKALVNKEVTPLQLTKEALERAKLNDDNAFEIIAEQEALNFASSLIEPEEDNPLWGIPYAIKDNFSTKDIETTAGSNILKGYIPLFDATVVAKLKQAKAILIGKNTLDELAMGGSGITGKSGITYNPYDPTHKRQVGGSSCGSAASVAASIVPFSIGSDTGDSVRKPASYAGLVGFKPTWGRISRYGLFPFAPSLDHVGYFTRCVQDSSLLLNILAGHDEKDATSYQGSQEKFDKNINQPIKGKKVAIINEIYKSFNNRDILNKFDLAINYLKSEGVQIDYLSISKPLLEAIYPTYIIISCAEATSNNANLDGIKFGPGYWHDAYQEAIKIARSEGFSELIKRRFVIGGYALLKENQQDLFLRAQKARKMIVEAINKVLNDYDYIIAPATPTIAPYFEQSSDRLSEQYLIADNHLVIGNLAGLPSLSIPLGMKENMPFGISITARAYAENELFNIAYHIEKHTGYFNLRYAGTK
jgi:aspartyl-tRNA(Asn)/glutamyl-tRNA(Gln) amidotransferase subunit A